jgi:hypothetical protein
MPTSNFCPQNLVNPTSPQKGFIFITIISKKKGNAKKNQSSDPVFFSRQSEDAVRATTSFY